MKRPAHWSEQATALKPKPAPAKDSWWVGKTREQFYAVLPVETERMMGVSSQKGADEGELHVISIDALGRGVCDGARLAEREAEAGDGTAVERVSFHRVTAVTGRVPRKGGSIRS